MIGDAAAEYSAFFAGKVIGMIRAPDDYLYPPPFNIIEIFLVAPLEYVTCLILSIIHLTTCGRFVITRKAYAKVSSEILL